MKNKKEDFGDELAERFLNFAVRIIKLSAALPETPAGKHIANQLLRCEFRRKTATYSGNNFTTYPFIQFPC